MSKKILIIDIETSGFSKANDKILEVGIVSLDLDNGDKQILFDEVTHESNMTLSMVEKCWIVENSDLTVEDIRYSTHLNKYKPVIQKIINDHGLGCTAYNNKFDFGFMDFRGFTFPKKLDCPMLLSTDICQIPKVRGKGFKWPSVEEAYKFFFPDSNYVELHRGADDAMHEADIVYELYQRGLFKLN